MQIGRDDVFQSELNEKDSEIFSHVMEGFSAEVIFQPEATINHITEQWISRDQTSCLLE